MVGAETDSCKAIAFAPAPENDGIAIVEECAAFTIADIHGLSAAYGQFDQRTGFAR